MSESRDRRRLLTLRLYPISRIAANGNVELSHKYRELRADGFPCKARLEAVVVIVTATAPNEESGSGETVHVVSGGSPEHAPEPNVTGTVLD
jgi:hypothetical protein